MRSYDSYWVRGMRSVKRGFSQPIVRVNGIDSAMMMSGFVWIVRMFLVMM